MSTPAEQKSTRMHDAIQYGPSLQYYICTMIVPPLMHQLHVNIMSILHNSIIMPWWTEPHRHTLVVVVCVCHISLMSQTFPSLAVLESTTEGVEQKRINHKDKTMETRPTTMTFSISVKYLHLSRGKISKTHHALQEIQWFYSYAWNYSSCKASTKNSYKLSTVVFEAHCSHLFIWLLFFFPALSPIGTGSHRLFRKVTLI